MIIEIMLILMYYIFVLILLLALLDYNSAFKNFKNYNFCYIFINFNIF